jgi:putative transposase
MTNHVHLLMSPGTTDGIGRVLQSVGRRYVGRFNKRQGRTGTLWEGRYRATPVDADHYLFACYRYIELNPVRANMVADPADYRWSSYPANALGHDDPLVTPHEAFLALGTSPERRRAAYRDLCRSAIEESVLHSIREATHRASPLGNEAFRIRLSTMAARSSVDGQNAPPLLVTPN